MRSVPNRNTKNQQLWFTFSKQRRIWSFHVAAQERTVKKCTKNYNARAQLLLFSLNLLFGDVLVAVAIVFCVRSLISNSPGKKLPTLHGQLARVSGNKTPSQPSCTMDVNQPAQFKMRNDTYYQPAHKGLWSLPAIGGVRFD